MYRTFLFDLKRVICKFARFCRAHRARVQQKSMNALFVPLNFLSVRQQWQRKSGGEN